jgi:hypothetical protein
MFSEMLLKNIKVNSLAPLFESPSQYWGTPPKKDNISLDEPIAIVMNNGPAPLYGIADPSRAYSWTVGRSSRGIPQLPGA